MPRAWGRLACAALISMAAAVPLTSTVMRFTGMQRSIWLRLVVTRGAALPPEARVVYGDGARATLPVLWDTSARSTLLGLRSEAAARLLTIDTDRGVAPPWLAPTWAANWQRAADPPSLLLRGPGTVDIPGSFRRFTLTFARSPGTVDVGWLDQRARIDISRSATSSVTLEAPEGERGWVLLPPVAIDRLSIRCDSGADGVSLIEAATTGPRPQVWSPASGVGAQLRAGSEIRLRGPVRLNHVPGSLRVAIWALLAASMAAVLWLLRLASQSVNPGFFAGRLAAGGIESRIDPTAQRRTLVRIAAAVTACTLVYHLSYAVAVPVQYNFDSLGYYAFGRNFLHSHSLASIATCRTPGYPAVIAMTIGLFGDQLWTIVLVQHLAMCVLGGVVVWFLYPRVGRLGSALGGLLAGASPATSLMANAIWTEALFIALATAALLVFLRADEPRFPALAAAGLLAGIATLVRPNGAALLMLMGLWLFLKWWCRPSGDAPLAPFVTSASVIVGSFSIVVAPWLLHVHRVTGAWTVSDTNCAQDGQRYATLPQGVQPTNVLQLAGFVNLSSQSDLAATLAIAQPYRVFFEFFPARHRYHVESILPWELIYDERFPGELFREYIRTFPGVYVRQVRDALIFNIAHRTPEGASVFVYPDVEDMLNQERGRIDGGRPPVDARVEAITRVKTITWADSEVLLSAMKHAGPRRLDLLRALHLRLNGAAISLWGWLFGLASLAGAWTLFVPGQRRFALLAAHAWLIAAAPALLGMGADRYAMAGEPALYVLIALAFGAGRAGSGRDTAGHVSNDTVVA